MAYNNIFAQYMGPPKSVAAFSAEMDEADSRRQVMQQNKLALAAGKQKFDDDQHDRAGQNKITDLLKIGKTPDQIGADLALSGYGRTALAYTKQQQDAAKAKADMDHTGAQTGKIEYEQREAKRQKAISDIAAFESPDQAIASLALHEKNGDIAPEQAAMIRQTLPQNPADFPKWQLGMLKRIMSAKDAVGQMEPDANATLQATTSTANNVANNARIQSDSALSRGVQIREQNLRDARSRESRADALTKPFEVTGPDGTPVLVQQTRNGIVPVEGYSPKRAPLKPLPPAVVKTLTEARDNAVTMDRLKTSFKAGYGGKGLYGIGADTSMSVKGYLGADQNSVAWWKDYRKNAELTERHALFGAALTPTEQASWRSADISPGMDSEVITTNLATRAALTKKIAAAAADDMVDAGHNEGRVRAIAGRGEDKPAAANAGAYSDAGKERRYQEWKARQAK